MPAIDSILFTAWPRRSVLTAVAFLCCSCSSSSRQPSSSQLTVAAAANLTDIFNRLGPRFEKDTGIHPVFSFASTAQLTRQIENAAPFDVLAAADAEHVDELDRKGMLTHGSRAVYATGILALWIPAGSKASVTRVEDLAAADVKVIAVAKPELAPYGAATVETLRGAGIWDQVKAKVVYAENISMARQYGASNNADAVFTAYSLVLHDAGKVIQVDEKLHRPIVQELGIVAASSRQAEARRFTDFLLRGPGREALAQSGYRIPSR